MKKTIAMLLVAMLTVGSVFAAFTGSADIKVGVNLDDKAYGILDQGTGFTVGFELATAEGESAGEGDVYASIKGSMVLEVFKAPDWNEGDTPKVPGINKWDENHFIGFGVDIDEAKIAGSNWYLSILGMPGEPDFAKSAIDTWKSAKKSYGVVVDKDGSTSKASVAMTYHDETYGGIELGIADYVVGGSLWGTYGDASTFNLNGYVMTPEYDFDGVTVQVGAAASAEKGAGTVAAGVSGKFGYSNDTFTLGVASDVVLGIPASDGADFAFDMDIAANAKYDFITFDGYYATDVKVNGVAVENLLSLRAAFDLNAFDLPLSITVGMKDIINKSDLFGEVSTSIENISLTLSGECAFQVEKDWEIALKAGYSFDAGTVTATVGYAGDNSLTTEIVFKTTTLVPGATLTFGWEDADLLNETYGVISAACSIEF